MPTFVNDAGKLVTIDPTTPSNKQLIEVLRKGGMREIANMRALPEGLEDQQEVVSKLNAVKREKFTHYPPFDSLIRRYPDARDAEEMFAAALETEGFESFTIQDAVSCMRYWEERDTFYADNNSSDTGSE